MSDPAIGDIIIAAIGSEDTAVERMAAIVAGLERAGFSIIPRAQYEALVDLREKANAFVRLTSPDFRIAEREALCAAIIRAAGIQTEGEGT